MNLSKDQIKNMDKSTENYEQNMDNVNVVNISPLL